MTHAQTGSLKPFSGMSSLAVLSSLPSLQMAYISHSISKQLSRCIITVYLYIPPVTIHSVRNEAIVFIFAFLLSTTGSNKVEIKFYRLHEQINKQERERHKK